MSRQIAAFAWYRFRATWRGRWGGYVTVVLLLAGLGGLAMGAVAAARRTQSSYPTYIASTHPSNLGALTAVLNPAFGTGAGYDPAVVTAISHLPDVKRVVSAVGLDMAPLRADGAPISNAYLPLSAGNALGSVNGLGFSVDRLAVTVGRLADPTRIDEFDTLPSAAAAFGFHVGEVIAFGIYTNAQTELPGFGTAAVRPYRRIDLKLVGLGTESTSLVQDQTDITSELGVFTPALTAGLLKCCVNYTETALQIADPGRNLPDVETAIAKLLPKVIPATFVTAVADTLAKAERAIKPESIALGAFGAIAAAAALLIVGQVLGRQRRLQAAELGTLPLGASPAMLFTDDLVGTLAAVALGSLLAVVVAVALSPLAPLGPVRPVYPSPGISFDWTVLSIGFVVLLVCLSLLAAGHGYRETRERGLRRERVERSSGIVRTIAGLGFSASSVTGVRFALEPGSGRNTVPVRSAILGAALAVIVVTTTVTFGASLNALVSTPHLYGWNWNYLLSGGGGGGDIPEHRATQLLNGDHDVSAWAAAWFAGLAVDGRTVPVIGMAPGASIQPPMLAGHGLDGAGQIVLGAVTLADLHKRIGDSVKVSDVVGGATSLRIVGTATMPTLGGGGGEHLEMGTGAVVSYQLIPPGARNPFNDPQPGPEGIFVRLRRQAAPAAALASLEKMTGPLSNTANFGVAVVPVLLPAEIVNYRSLGATPAILGASLGVGAALALGLTLLASVRRRRRDLALLKTLGFTNRQLASVLAWQSSVAVGIGTIVGVPVGIVLGRFSWELFAREINAVPAPTVGVLTIVLIVVGALVLANLVAAVPGRIAARTPTALLLRAE